MLCLIFLILRILGIVNTSYDWLIFALLYIGDCVADIPEKIEKVYRRKNEK